MSRSRSSVLLVGLILVAAACAAPEADTDNRGRESAAGLSVASNEAVPTIAPDLETAPGSRDQWGIDVRGICLTAGGYMLDFRYRVVDPDLALPLFDPKVRPYLESLETGGKYFVPSPPKAGPLRQTTRQGSPRAGSVCYVLFANPGRFIQAGDRVVVVIGEFRSDPIVVG